MIGIVLCGGQSTRMGTDKGLRNHSEGPNWAALAKAKLEFLKIPVYISVNPGQVDSYNAHFAISDMIPDRDDLEVKGPLTGIMSAHRKFPGDDLFFLACDMIHMDPPILKELYSHSIEQPEPDVFCFELDGQPEPLCSIFRAASLRKLHTIISKKQLEKFSLKYVLSLMRTIQIPVLAPQKKAFSNMNSPSDFH